MKFSLIKLPFVFAFTITLFSNQICFGSDYYTQEHEVYARVLGYLDYWFYPNHNNNETLYLADIITKEIVLSGNYALHNKKTFETSYIYLLSLEITLNHIQASIESYAYYITNASNANILISYLNDDLDYIVGRIVFSGAYYSQKGTLAHFIGNHLNATIDNLYYDTFVRDSYYPITPLVELFYE